jgi:predicted  nucleic acid-binding Zn-ribbon protein
MHDALKKVVELQTIDVRVAVLEGEVAALPKRLVTLESRLKATHSRVEAAKAALAQEETRRRRMESDISDLKQKAEKFRSQTNSVKTNEQLHALQHEIGFAEQEIRRIEDGELESMETTERLQGDLKREEAEQRVEVVAVEAEKARAREVSGRDEAEISELKKQRAELRKGIPEELLAIYDRVSRSARKTGIAEVRAQECLGCHVRLRPQGWNELRAGGVMTCESCGRLLYYDEGNDAKLAAVKAGKLDVP